MGFAACDDGTGVEVPATETALKSVAPEGGASNVASDEEVVVTFDGAMHDHAVDYADVHQGDVKGPAVPGSWMMEEGGTVMRFTPADPWEMGTEYTIHLGGGMVDAAGRGVDFEAHGMSMGGMWADGSMMGGGMGAGHTGDGWRHENGTYGMLFDFSTENPPAALTAMDPPAGATDVDPTAPVVVRFDRAMHGLAAEYADLHEGDVSGPEVAGRWALSTDSTRLVFTQDEALKPGTRYAVHLGGGMMDADGNHVDLETHGEGMGGMWADSSMMDDGMHEGGMGGGHTGEGWQHGNGSYGMVFSFTTAGTAPASALVAVEPRGGATGVDPTAPVVVTFDHAIDPAMTGYAALHEGDVNGPEVAGTWTLSGDSTRMVFTQDEPLKPATQYTVHLGGNMMDADGHHVDLGTNGTHVGGEWAMGSMMGGGMMGGEHQHMGEGWEHPYNGSYGMIFTFTTAG